MSRSNSVLNFREIIINGIQDLEQGVKQRNQERSSSQKKISQNQIDSPLPCFQSTIEDSSPNNLKYQDLSCSPKTISQNQLPNKQEFGLKEQNKIQLQQFKIPQFTNPSQKNNKNTQQVQQGFKLSNNSSSNQIGLGYDYQQKENSAFGGGECTFREKNNTNDFKGVKVNQMNSDQNYSQFDNTRRNDKIDRKNNQIKMQLDKNERQYYQQNSGTQNYIQSPLMSRMENENELNLSHLKNSSKFESNKQIQEHERNVDYFSIYDNPYQDRQNIFKALKINSPQTKIEKNNFMNLKPSFDQNNLSQNNIQSHLKRAKSSNNLKGNEKSFQDKSNQQKKKEVIKRSVSQKKGVNLSPPKKTQVQFKKNTLERFPSQVSFTESLRSYTPNGKNTSQKITLFTVNKENLKKTVLNYEYDQLRGIYNLTSFIKFFRELGLMQVKQEDNQNLQQEIQVVEELWRLLKFSSYSAECVSTSFIYQIVLIVIDCQTYKPIQASSLIDSLCQKEYQKYSNFFEQEREKSQIHLSYDIVNGIRDALSVSEKNENLFKNIENKKDQNQKAKIGQIFQHTQFLKTESDQYRTNRSNSQNQITNYSDEDTIIDLQKNGLGQSNKKQIEQNSLDSHQQSLKGDFSNRKSERNSYLNQQNVHKRLYNHSHSKTRVISDQQQAKQIKEQNELNECTFQPKINKNTQKILQKSLSNLQLQKIKEPQEQEDQSIRDTIKGVKQSLQRMEQAREQRSYKQNYWENQRLKYQNYINRSPSSQNFRQQEKQVNLNPSSEKIKTEKKLREKPMLYVDINISKSKTGKIAIYQGDIPEDVANNFAKIYKLNTTATQKLVKKLKDIIQAYYAQLYDQF